MPTTKIRTSIITAVAALSIVSLGSMTSVAGARKPIKEVKIGHIEVECPLDTGNGVEWYPEGTRKVFETQEPPFRAVELECKDGNWISVQRAPTPPKTNQSGPPALTLTNG